MFVQPSIIMFLVGSSYYALIFLINALILALLSSKTMVLNLCLQAGTNDGPQSFTMATIFL